MMAIRSHKMSASSMLCVVSTMARSALCRRMMSHVNLGRARLGRSQCHSRLMHARRVEEHAASLPRLLIMHGGHAATEEGAARAMPHSLACACVWH